MSSQCRGGAIGWQPARKGYYAISMIKRSFILNDFGCHLAGGSTRGQASARTCLLHLTPLSRTLSGVGVRIPKESGRSTKNTGTGCNVCHQQCLHCCASRLAVTADLGATVRLNLVVRY